jgi:hypothetical protein
LGSFNITKYAAVAQRGRVLPTDYTDWFEADD